MKEINKLQHFDIPLNDIIPEYESKNIFVRTIFNRRLQYAIGYIWSLDKIKRLLDVGCGNGKFTYWASCYADSTIGIDFNVHTEELNSVDVSGVTYLRQNILEYKPVGQFDVITCLDVLEHFENADEVISKIKEWMSPGGHLIVSVPTESIFYRIGRFLLKGSFSKESPCAGKHYYDAKSIHKIICKHFDLVQKRKVMFLFLHLFDVSLFKARNENS